MAMRIKIRLGGAMLLAAALGGCAGIMETAGDPYVAPGKFHFLRCPDLATRLQEADARHRELLALMERSGSGVGGGAVNMFVYQPDVNNVEAELRALQATAAEKKCPTNVIKAPAKPEPGMGPIH
jgi:spore germination cell wall hydrolase CwlJ-like protein